MFNEQSHFADFKKKGNAAIEYIKGEIVNMRSGKASASLVENIIVHTYERTATLKLEELTTIHTNGPSEILLTPFDYATIKDIEKALLISPLHLNPQVEGKTIRLKLPPLSEEQRKQLLKVAAQKIEEGKVRVRMARDAIRKKVKEAFEKKECVKDQKFRLEKEIDTMTQQLIKAFEQMEDKKTREIMDG